MVGADGVALIAGVKVELAQNWSAIRRGSADSQGFFRFEAVMEGDYSVELTKDGYNHVAASPAESTWLPGIR